MDSNWNQQSLNVLFGSNVDEISNRLGNLVYNAFNHWIWCSSSNISNISASIYKFVNYNKGSAITGVVGREYGLSRLPQGSNTLFGWFLTRGLTPMNIFSL